MLYYRAHVIMLLKLPDEHRRLQEIPKTRLECLLIIEASIQDWATRQLSIIEHIGKQTRQMWKTKETGDIAIQEGIGNLCTRADKLVLLVFHKSEDDK